MSEYDDLIKHDLSWFIARAFATVDPRTAYLPNWHIELIAAYLEAAGRGDINRLIINMPPRALKSICVSVAWPAWLLGHDPARRIMAASYSSALALKHSLDCRRVIAAPWYQALFPDMRIAPDQNQKHKFLTTANGFRFATSVGGTVTGEGGNFLIVDDPLNAAQAMNEYWRDRANRWFDHTFASRLNDKRNGVIVLVMQRLHQHDLTGHLLAKGGWQHLCLPAVTPEAATYYGPDGKMLYEREAGELLHPAREDQALIKRAKIELGSAAFAAQYLQQPQPEEGAMLRPWWFKRYQEVPAVYERRAQSWDTAIKSGRKHDASACLTFAESGGGIYLLDVTLFRLEYPGLKRAFYTLAEQWKPNVILLEDKGSGQQLFQDARRDSFLPVIAVSPKTDKLTRFAGVSAIIESGRVFLPAQAPWLADFESELYAFPGGAHDDQVDALTQYLDWLRHAPQGKPGVRGI